MVVSRKQKSKVASRSGVSFDALENRTLYANSSGVDVTLPDHIAAPPAIVEYAGISTGQDSLPVDPNSNQGVERRQLSVYNCTFSGSSFGRPMFWTSVRYWYPGGKLDLSRTAIERAAELAQNGGPDKYIRDLNIAPKSMTVADFEIENGDKKSPTYYADRLRWFKAKAPDAMVGTYGIQFSPGMNLTQLATFDEATRAEFDRQVLARREIIDASDFICFDTYMLGPDYVDRDILARKNYANEMRRLFPDKPIIPFVWGIYHTAFYTPGTPFSDEVLDKFVKMCAETFDGVIIWGPRNENENLIAAFGATSNLLMPVGRRVSWANDAVTQDPPPASLPSSGSGSTEGTVGQDVLGLNP